MTTALYVTLFTIPTTGHDHGADEFANAQCKECYPYQVGSVVFPTIESAAAVQATLLESFGLSLKVVVRCDVEVDVNKRLRSLAPPDVFVADYLDEYDEPDWDAINKGRREDEL